MNRYIKIADGRPAGQVAHRAPDQKDGHSSAAGCLADLG